MNPSDLPVSVTDKIYRAPLADRLSQNDVKALLAYFWPSITEHLAQQLLDQNPDRVARTMAHTIAELDKAYAAIVSEINLPKYGIGSENAEWQRKYGSGSS